MSLLVMGLSHHNTPFDLLERVAANDERASAFERRALAGEHIREAILVSTCNRTELYAEALTFHGALADLTAAFSASTDLPLSALEPHLHVHYDERAVAHVFSVAAGLDSMAIGEAQILGQLRSALGRAQQHGHVGPELNSLVQQALRVGKRVHSETDVDSVSSSLVDAGLDRARDLVGAAADSTVLLVGAGGMGALAATVARRRGIGALHVTNRGPERAQSLAERVGAEVVAWDDRDDWLSRADIVITSTGAPGCLISADAVRHAARARPHARPQVYLDLALPHDVDRAAAEVPGVTLIGLSDLGALLARAGQTPEVQAARDLVTAEVAAHLGARAVADVIPTVRALRAGAQDVVEAELARLARRTPDLEPAERAEVEKAMHRVVDKLLHTPTVRVREQARRGQGGSYARALSELFDLDPADVLMVSATADLPVLDDAGKGAI